MNSLPEQRTLKPKHGENLKEEGIHIAQAHKRPNNWRHQCSLLGGVGNSWNEELLKHTFEKDLEMQITPYSRVEGKCLWTQNEQLTDGMKDWGRKFSMNT